MPDLQLAQQADGEHLNTGQNQHTRNHEERSMGVHHGLMSKNLEAG